MVPKKIFQTHKSLDYINRDGELVECVKSWKKLAPEYDYQFFNNNDCDSFMKKNYGGHVYKAYKRSQLNVMKADIWRYCVIHFYGGIYSDTDTLLLAPPSIFQNDDAIFIGVPEHNVHFCQWVFAASKNSPVLESVIEHIAQLMYDNDNYSYEHCVHKLTGPGAFTKGIEKYLKQNNLPTFNNILDYKNYPDKRILIHPHKGFHDSKVIHKYAGYKPDGWKKERDELIKLVN